MRRLWILYGLPVVALVSGGCATSSIQRADGELSVLTEAGRAAYAQGAAVKAAELYGHAYQRGLLIDQPIEAGRNAYNAALCYLAMNRSTEAGRMLGEARRLLACDARAMARVELAEAELALHGGNRISAGHLAKRVVAGRSGDPERCQAALLLAEIALANGNAAEALSWYKGARDAGVRGLAPLLAARRDGVGAQLVYLGVLKGSAGELYASQAVYLRDGGAYGEMAVALLNAGDAFRAAGKVCEAFAAYERAVNTFVALGNGAAAAGGVAKAIELGIRLDGAVYDERIRLLRELVR